METVQKNKYTDIAVYRILLKGDSFGEMIYDPEGRINGGKPFVLYTPAVKGFMQAVKAYEQTMDTIVEKSKEGAEKGDADKELVVALLKSIVSSEEYAPGTLLERLKDGTIRSLLWRLQ